MVGLEWFVVAKWLVAAIIAVLLNLGFSKPRHWRWLRFESPVVKIISVAVLLLMVVGYLLPTNLVWIKVVLYGAGIGLAVRVLRSFMDHAQYSRYRVRQEQAYIAREKQNAVEYAETEKMIGARCLLKDLGRLSVYFLDKRGELKVMKGNGFFERNMPEGDEPTTWLIRHWNMMEDDQLTLISRHGWRLSGIGRKIFVRDEGETRIWKIVLVDREGIGFEVEIPLLNRRWENNGQSLKQEAETVARVILGYATTYTNANHYVLVYVHTEIAKSLREMKSNLRSPRLARIAEIATMSTEELGRKFYAKSLTPNIAAYIETGKLPVI